NMVEGQWFLNYSNPEWKEKVYRCIEKMEIIPEEYRVEFNNKVDWLKDKACARKKGLGTHLPFDDQWLIESLGDSTIYMTYYITNKFFSRGIGPEHLTPQLFDYVLLGKGSVQQTAAATGLDEQLIAQMKQDMDYWYPVDLRSSGKDLVPNHLLFFLFHHVAIFDEDKWPRALAVNGFVSLEGQKMSKSKGPLLTLRNAVDEYGADISRMYILSSAEQTQDADWRNSGVEAAKKQVERFYSFAREIIESGAVCGMCGELKLIDRWMLSRLQHRIRETNNDMGSLRTRSALQNAFFLLLNDIKWYQKRGGSNLLYDMLDTWVRLMAPFMPHVCEDIWQALGHEGSDIVSLAHYPVFDPELLNNNAELAEELVDNTLEDIEEILKVTKMTPKKIVLYTSAAWKTKAFRMALKMQAENKLEIGILIKTLMAEPTNRPYGKEIPKFVQKIVPDISSMKLERLEMFDGYELDELAILGENQHFFEKEFNCTVEVYSADEPGYDPENKSRFAVPMRPAIYLE
ncbi:MAG: class I tRNA ligase family protein, partial [Methanomethylovorans sp.]|nr:class I tRNA ligase family protein [Methanomethylovorans sp.]